MRLLSAAESECECGEGVGESPQERFAGNPTSLIRRKKSVLKRIHQMAGVKGKSGGARPGTGGARPGAGRKPKPPPEMPMAAAAGDDLDPKNFLLTVMNDEEADPRLRMDAAKALLPFVHQKLGEGGKKDARLDSAKKAGAGKFSAAAPPLRLVK